MDTEREAEVEFLRTSVFLRRITIKQAAKKAGIPAQRLGRLLRGDRVPHADEIKKVARANGIAS